MKKLVKPDTLLQDKLYIGTSELVAKLAPVKGLSPLIYLTDVYTGFFCQKECEKAERWGIITVTLSRLITDMFAPTPAYIKFNNVKNVADKLSGNKHKWQKSLQETGVCAYLAPIPPSAIERIMIYNNNGSNEVINKFISELPNPYKISHSEHKSLYKKSLGVAKWLNGEQVNCNDMLNGEDGKYAAEVEDKLHNRFGLDLYYIRAEEKIRKAASKKI